jgi:hypothetical protein
VLWPLVTVQGVPVIGVVTPVEVLDARVLGVAIVVVVLVWGVEPKAATKAKAKPASVGAVLFVMVVLLLFV